jgi:hypothetical protein
MVNGCAVHSSHRLFTLHLKICQLVALTTRRAATAHMGYQSLGTGLLRTGDTAHAAARVLDPSTFV